MGFNLELSVLRLENHEIEIRPLKTEDLIGEESVTISSLFNCVLSENACNPNIDISKITILELSHCNLTEVPILCKKLNLKHLGLSHNNLKSVPLCLYSGLKHLESLDISYNQIENFDIDPECVNFVKKIKLNNNKFKNIPKWFLMFKCTSLEELDYSHNKADHYRYLKNSFNLNIVKLKKLELKNNYLLDSDFDFLKCFKYLQYLDVSNEGTGFLNNFHELDELFVRPKWKELNILRLNNLSLGLFPEGIPWIETLKELYIANNSISWLPNGIEFLVNLEVLDISNNVLVSIPNNFLSMESLRVLKACNNCIEIVPDFSPMLRLKTLDLYDNLLDNINIDLTSITSVDLELNYYDTGKMDNHAQYEEGKAFLRRKLPDYRGDGPKEYIEKDVDEYSSKSDLDEYYELPSELPDATTVVASTDELEDWDAPVKIKSKNPNIDSSDEEWKGEDEKGPFKMYNNKERVYVSDEDWMFEDYEYS